MSRKRTFSVDLSHMIKYESITMILRVRSSRCKGNTITHHFQRRVMSNFQQTRWCSDFWDQHRVVMMNFMTKGTTINEACYAFPLQKLHDTIRAEKCSMLTKGDYLLQDKTPVHNMYAVQMKAHSCGYEIFPRLPYSHNLAPFDIQLFPAMKSFLWGSTFGMMMNLFLI